tara:strand:- start:141 stop:689 length:549 start_codon:yes stop_codon:yes gene_type:complete
MNGLVFDVLVIDVMMPGEDGLSLTSSIRGISKVPILLLTAMAEPENRVEGFEQGADDYMTKPFEPRELVLRVKSILRRTENARKKQIVVIGNCNFDIGKRELRRDNLVVRLTTIETTLLAVLALRPGVIMSRDELIERCQIDGGERTVDVQVTRLRRKIEPDPREPRFLQTIRGQGYVLQPD